MTRFILCTVLGLVMTQGANAQLFRGRWACRPQPAPAQPLVIQSPPAQIIQGPPAQIISQPGPSGPDPTTIALLNQILANQTQMIAALNRQGTPIIVSPAPVVPVPQAPPASQQSPFPIVGTPLQPGGPLIGTPLTPQGPLVGTPLFPQGPVLGTPLTPQGPIYGTPLVPQGPVYGTPVVPQGPLLGTPLSPGVPGGTPGAPLAPRAAPPVGTPLAPVGPPAPGGTPLTPNAYAPTQWAKAIFKPCCPPTPACPKPYPGCCPECPRR